MIDTGTSQILWPAKFHNFTVSGLFFIHKNKRVQFFMKHRVYQVELRIGEGLHSTRAF